jgi:RNA polymerase sigma factor (TIGR02999 family)
VESDPQVTDLLLAWRRGEADAFDQLMPLVYDALRALAQRHLDREGSANTLTPTGLVHEAYLRLVDRTRVEVTDRGQFFAIASQAMRRILVDRARRRLAEKRGGSARPVSLDEQLYIAEAADDSIVALDEALERLAGVNPRLARVVECRFFAGLTEIETGEALGITERTVRRDWTKARGWLYQALA